MTMTREVFQDCENKGNWFAWGCKSKEQAAKLIAPEAEVSEEEVLTHLSAVFMYKCLDCESYWVSDDVCGECGEYRLSKRAIPAYYFEDEYKETL